MSLSKSKCWHSNKCLHFLKSAVPLAQQGRLLGKADEPALSANIFTEATNCTNKTKQG